MITGQIGPIAREKVCRRPIAAYNLFTGADSTVHTVFPVAWLNGWELPAIIVVILLLFGGTKIPQLMRGLGRGVGEFKKGIEEGRSMLENSVEELDEKQQPKQP